MVLPLVVGVDGSEPGLHAVDWAVDEAVRHGLPLRIVHASLWERYESAALADTPGAVSDVVTEHDLAESVVARAAQRARQRAPALQISTGVVPEDPVSALLGEARLADAVVTGVRGRGPIKELLLGSVSLSLAARSPCPVVVVRGRAENRQAANGRIVVGVGGATAPAAVRYALREGAVRGCEVEAVRAWRRPAHRTVPHPLLTGEPAHAEEDHASALLDEAVDGVAEEYSGVIVHRAFVEGSARHALVVRSSAADLLVIGARRRRGHLGPQLGLVGHAVLHHSECPVAVVPQQE
ncbi:universal stress protein [Streptomyces viridochromogenes]|uniref:Universal stress protein n=1 Tax=Streptomyces viridochromogenes TaxID=1938 RepID=A0A0J7YXK8_STRVR|nr:universal stress protein [Streptomyces viridochromogenes]KOG08802.1 universal stress protein [Streptomyces viridochromogenes]KOG09142.1 universal stress protein [Streptomyces viridochromogenes]